MAEAKAKKEETKKDKSKVAVKKSTKDKEVKKDTKAKDKPVKKDNTKTKVVKKDTKKEVTKEAVKKAPVVKKESATPMTVRLKKFFKGALAELKKVHWPNKQQLTAFTTVVIVSVLLMAALIWVVDSGLTQLVKLVLKK